MKCRYPNCKRHAPKGWTTCNAHHTAGINMAQWRRIQKDRAKRDRHA